MTLSTHTFLQRRHLLIYLACGGMLIFMPYVYMLGYALLVLASVVWYLERTRLRLTKQLGVCLTQVEDLLFVEDESQLKLHLEGGEELERLGLPVRIRLKASSGLTFPDHERLPTLLERPFERGADQLDVTVKAAYRGPATIQECVLAVTLPFRLGTYLLEVQPSVQWTVLPSLVLHPPVGTKRLALGERPLLASSLRNPLQLLGSKPYEQEPVKEIDWYATAKLGRLQAKVFQKTTLDTFTFAVDLNGPSGYTLHHDFESLISQVAFVTTQLLKEECKVEMFLNRIEDSGNMVHIRLQEGERGMRLILLNLAEIDPGNRFISSEAFQRMVERKRLKQSHLVWFTEQNLYD